jgi:hypothetical protein
MAAVCNTVASHLSDALISARSGCWSPLRCASGKMQNIKFSVARSGRLATRLPRISAPLAARLLLASLVRSATEAGENYGPLKAGTADP